MRKVIDGKIYNTKTAEEVCMYSHSYPSDFQYVAYFMLHIKQQ